MENLAASGIVRAASRFMFNLDRIEKKYARVKPFGTVVLLPASEVVSDENTSTLDEIDKAVKKTEKAFSMSVFGGSHISSPVVELPSKESVAKCERINVAFDKASTSKEILHTAKKEEDAIKSFWSQEERRQLLCRKRQIEAVNDGIVKKLKLSQEEHFITYRPNKNGGFSKEVTEVYDKMTIQHEDANRQLSAPPVNLMLTDGESIVSGALPEDYYEKQLNKLKSSLLPSNAICNRELPPELVASINPLFQELAFKPFTENVITEKKTQKYKPLKSIGWNSQDIGSNDKGCTNRTKRSSKISLLVTTDEAVSTAGNLDSVFVESNGCNIYESNVENQKQQQSLRFLSMNRFQNTDMCDKYPDTNTILRQAPVQQRSNCDDCCEMNVYLRNTPARQKYRDVRYIEGDYNLLQTPAQQKIIAKNDAPECCVRDFSLRQTPARQKCLNQLCIRRPSCFNEIKAEDMQLRLATWLNDTLNRTISNDFEEDDAYEGFEKKFRRLRCNAQARNWNLRNGYSDF
uniref:PH domain-containing protein n=1 Tax=Syphacia muris TaxID=451379 RepID=A0A158R6C5_9BILA